jgi:trans-2,3-dihydro-3-hydroxyanthranilate isomerase
MGHKFYILDVFTKEAYSGNQLAVVEGADDLDETAMLAITREFGFSETVFLQTPSNPIASARARIFTPEQEIPFAGHPTVGTAVMLGEMKNRQSQIAADQLLLLEEGLGMVRCAVSVVPGAVTYAEFDSPALPTTHEDVPELDLVADALSLGCEEIGFENHKISSAELSVRFLFVPVRNEAVLNRVKPDFSYWEEAFDVFQPLGVYAYCRDEGGAKPGFNARMFAPDLGIMEDAATGAAAVAFASVIERFDLGSHKFYETRIEQGRKMGRPSLMKLEIEIADKKPRMIRLGGHAVRVAEGTLS